MPVDFDRSTNGPSDSPDRSCCGWRYPRNFDPNQAAFKAVFVDIERDMARQRAELAKRPKDAPLDPATVH
jgi:hypothetical protein